jgi:hypothetical protein
MLGPKGLRMALRYLCTRLVFGHPASVIVKLEDKGDHHHPANMDMGGDVSPPRPGTNWADWSDAMGREMYLRRALDRLNFEYPSDNAS